MPPTLSTKATRRGVIGLAVGITAGLAVLWRRSRRARVTAKRMTTWEELATQLSNRGFPSTLAGVAAMRGTDDFETLEWLRSQGDDLRETAEVLADGGLISDLAAARANRAAGHEPIPLDEVRRTLGRQR